MNKILIYPTGVLYSYINSTACARHLFCRRLPSFILQRSVSSFDDQSAPFNKPMGLILDETVKAEYIRNPCELNGTCFAKKTNFKPKRVLILSKTTRWEVISNKRISSDPGDEGLLLKHKQQTLFVDDICDQLKKHNIESTVVKNVAYTFDRINNADLVISAGGDGTFLAAASKIRDQTPVIGVNTDPVGSEGHLCLTGKENRNVREVIDQFLDGQFRFFPRQRIRVTLLKPSSLSDAIKSQGFEWDENAARLNSEEEEHQHVLEVLEPLLALNEVFVGESHAARVSYLEIRIDDGPVYKQKNSGLIVCTGTGSTSWNYNINRSTERSISELVSFMQEEGFTIKPPIDERGVEKLCRRHNERLIFAPDEQRMEYSIRDPVFNSTYSQIPERGPAKKIWIKSKCSHAHLTLDGSTSIPFNHGAEVLIEVHPEDALRTAFLSDVVQKPT